MRTRYKVVKKSATSYQGIAADFDANNNKISGDRVICTQTSYAVVDGKEYTVGRRSNSDSTGCAFRKEEPGKGGRAFDLVEVWDETRGWT